MVLVVIRDGRVAGLELFPEDQLDQALARSRELATSEAAEEVSTTTGTRIENECSRVLHRLVERWLQGDREAARASVSDTYVLQDRRRGLRHEAAGSEAWETFSAGFADIAGPGRGGTADFTTVAVRGERLSLVRVSLTDPSGFEIQFLEVMEIDDLSRLALGVIFDADAFDAAYVELDERFIAGEGAQFEAVVRWGTRFVVASNRFDMSELRTLLADDLVLHDHRPASYGEIGADQVIRTTEPLGALIQSRQVCVPRYLAIGRDAGAGEVRIEAVTAEGATVDMSRLVVTVIRDRRAVRMEYFPLDQVDEALARLGELTEPTTQPGQNLAAQTTARINDCVVRRDWETLETLLTEGSVFDDRRAGVSATLVGTEAQLANFRAVADVGADRIDTAVVATRGDRLALTRILFVVGDGLPESVEVEIFFVMEVDAEGRMTGASAFDLADVDHAYADLDERYATGEGLPFARMMRVAAEQARRLNAGDMLGYRRMLSDDLYVVDHQRVSVGDYQGADEFMNVTHVMRELVTSSRAEIVNVQAIAEDRGLGEYVSTVATADGVVAEFRYYVLQQLHARDYKVVRIEVFPLDMLDQALARFDELGAQALPTDDHPASAPEELDNACSLAVKNMVSLAARQDRAGLMALIAEDGVLDDRRQGLSWHVEGGSQVVDQVLIVYPEEVRSTTHTVGVRGERLSLCRLFVNLPNGYDFEFLNVSEINEQGRLILGVQFDPDDLDAAFAELDGRFIAGEGAPYAEILRIGTAQRDALRTGDMRSYRSLIDDDVVLVDHRHASLGELHGAEAVLEALGAFPIVRDLRPRAVAYHALTSDRILVEIAATGTSEHGGSVEVTHLRIQEIRNGRVSRIELFPLDALDAAVARFGELGLQAEPPTLDNAATRTLAAHGEHLAQGYDDPLYYAEDVVHEDRRVGFGGWRFEGREELMEHNRVSMVGVRRVAFEPVAIRGDRHALIRQLFTSKDFEIEALVLCELDENGRMKYTALFDTNDVDVASRELDERFLEKHDKSTPDKSTPDELRNATSNVFTRVLNAFEARDWDALGDLYADDFHVESRRVGLGHEASGREGSLEGWIAAADVGATRADATVVATRGDHLALTQVRFRDDDQSPQAFTTDVLFLNELDAEGRIVKALLFDADDWDSAFAELDERFIAGEGRESANLVRLSNLWTSALLERDWTAAEDLLTEEFVLVDHRLASLGEIRGRDAWLEAVRVHSDLIASGQSHAHIVTHHVLGSHGGVGQVLEGGVSAEGAEFEYSYLIVGLIRGKQISRLEIFPFESRAEAIARFRELELQTQSFLDSHRPANACTRTIDRIFELATGRDEASSRSLYAESYTFFDRRRALGFGAEGADAIDVAVGGLGWHDIEISRVRYETIATRGDSLALHRVVVLSADDFDVEFLTFNSVDDEGRLTAGVVFDPDDLDSAFAELEERYLAGEGAPFADVWRPIFTLMDRYNNRDWEAFRSLLDDDVVFTDHRPASFGALTVEKWLESIHVQVDLAPNMRFRMPSVPYLGPRFVVWEALIRGSTRHGGDVELAFINLAEVRRGRIIRYEWFPLPALKAALARARELSAESPVIGPGPENNAVHWGRRLEALNGGRDWDEIRSLIHADFVGEDRRRGFGSVVRGPDAQIEMMKTTIDVGSDPDSLLSEPIAIRGERLALWDVCYRTRDFDFEVRTVELEEYTADGLLFATAAFDPEAIDDAFAELEERWLASQDATETDRLVARFFRAYSALNTDACREVLADDLVYVDNRPASFGTRRGVDAFIEQMDGLRSLVSEMRARMLALYKVGKSANVTVWRRQANDENGNPVVWDHLTAGIVRDGRIQRIEHFPPDRFDLAMRRAEELDHDASGSLLVLENAATRGAERFSDAFVRRDWTSLAEVFADDLVRDDRRPGIGGIAGKDSVVEAWKAMAELGYDTVRFETLAIRGTRLALSRALVTGEHDFENEAFIVFEADDEGHCKSLVYFESDDLDAATDELNERWVAGEASEFPEMLRAGARAIQLINAQDWEAFEDLYAPDFVFMDHRPISAAELRGALPLLELVKGLADLVPDIRYQVVDVPRMGREALVSRLAGHGTNSEGGRVDFTYLQVHQFVGDKQLRLERFDLDQYDLAVARFEELLRSGSSDLANDASRWQAEIQELSQRLDWTTLAERISPDAVYVDNRRGLGFRGVGREKVVEFVKASWPADSARMTLEYSVLAVRGDLLELQRTLAAMRDGYEVELLGVFEFDRDGLQTYCAFFDADDRDAAFAELDRRYIAQGELTEGVRNALESFVAYNARDWDLWESMVAPDIVYIDHAPASIGELHGRSEYLRHVQRLIALAPDLQMNLLQQIGESPGVLLGAAHSVGTDEHGGRIEREHLGIMVVENGVFVRVETFPPERRDEAVVRYEELAAESDRSIPDSFHDDRSQSILQNACTRAGERYLTAFNSHDWEGIVGSLTEDVRTSDRRLGMRNDIRGRDEALRQYSMWETDPAGAVLSQSVLAIRGDRLGLFSHSYTIRNRAYEIEFLSVVGINEEGQRTDVVYFDHEDLDAAFAELDDRYLSSGDAPDDERVALSMVHAYNDRDWDRYRSVVEGFVNVDHHPVSKGTVLSTDEYLQGVFALVELVPDSRMRLLQVYVGEPRWGGVGHVRWTGTNEIGGEVESDFAAVVLVGGGRMTRLENYPIEDLDAALARFEDLAKPGPVVRRRHATLLFAGSAISNLERRLGSSRENAAGTSCSITDERSCASRIEGKMQPLSSMQKLAQSAISIAVDIVGYAGRASRAGPRSD